MNILTDAVCNEDDAVLCLLMWLKTPKLASSVEKKLLELRELDYDKPVQRQGDGVQKEYCKCRTADV